MSLMEGKKGLIMGVANERSIAWGIAQKLSESGAELAFTYLGDALKKRVIPLAEKLNSNLTFSCDVEKKDEVIKLFEDIKSKWGQIDFVVHAIAFSDKSELSGEYLNTSRENFLRSMLISCFSFTEVAKEASKIMNKNGSLVTLSYEASKAIPNYNVMGVCKAALEASVKYLARDLGSKGIRVNAISAGPIKTLAASAIGDAKFLYKWNADHSFLKRNVDNMDVGNSALYLLSDMAGGVTGNSTSKYYTIQSGTGDRIFYKDFKGSLNSQDIIFIEERNDYNSFDRFKDIVQITSQVLTILAVMNNLTQ